MQRTRALGHLFVFVSGEAEARRRMGEAGLRVTCARACLDPDGAVGREVDRPPVLIPRSYSPGGRRRSSVIGKARCGVSLGGS